ncbi:MAG: peptidoglycan glycosyltransferase [Bacteroidetes bacterium]|nr:peptidoglycan glycosyltransferase [Bacteroidota bacterium]MBT3748157.1 peptidoglycan glycosyltransferase [Bacteroidota bacterium]MBT4411527.1 peptidoglycan glycosyltransferase [Bacteroidota bacterium]MBT5425912.1 peptidoglycan glycosyltransferase [Bacteroidota bacterium]MBT7094182.1 peptidoglycan glycosyltransferase [Bacteroidota bacterium]
MQGHFANRKFIIGGAVLLVAIAFIIKLSILQLINPKYKLSANSNTRQRQTEYPARGKILDRYNNVLVYNEAAYDLMVLPRQVVAFDSLEMCEMLEIDHNELVQRLARARDYSTSRPSLLLGRISGEQYAELQEKLFKYPGFYIQGRAQRAYQKKVASHVLGYVGEAGLGDLRQDSYYAVGDYLGASGIEKEYEDMLRGKKGVSYYMVDVHGRVQGSYEQAKYDTLPVHGQDITTTLDVELQAYGEQLMKHKKGSIVVIEPQTGEILTLVSSPSYELSSLIGRQRSESFASLQTDTLDPLFNRATMSRYAPGSIFKIVQALIGLELGVINVSTGFACNKDLIGCHNHPEATDVKKAIQFSCNPYFYEVYKRIIQPRKFSSIFRDSEAGIQVWRDHVLSFGLGTQLQVDLPNIKAGFIPDAAFYDKWYGHRRWAFSTIYSNSNGQGEVESVPIQIANLAAIIANRGYYIVPHFVKAIEGESQIPDIYHERKYTTVRPSYFDISVEAMYDVVWEPFGTGRRARVPNVSVCGKTGTVENVHGEDHSGFFAFAPMDDPKIAIAVYVENAGSGGEWAAPIASLMIEKYLTKEVSQTEKEKRILEKALY